MLLQVAPFPPFFTNLLPEGRRLSTLKRTVKASLDDELALLLAVGSDTIGDVSVLPHGQTPSPTTAAIDLDGELDFSGALARAGIADPIAVPGVQDKASARTIAAPVRGQSCDYILKVSPPEYPKLELSAERRTRIASIPAMNCEFVPASSFGD